MTGFGWAKGGSSNGKAGYWLWFDYDAEIIRKLKEIIPSYLREWNSDNKKWWVSELCEKQINDLFPGFLEAVVAQQRLF